MTLYGTQLRGRVRRAQIAVFVTLYAHKHGRGPRTVDIMRAVGYRSHSIRARHLEKMPGLVQNEAGRWEWAE